MYTNCLESWNNSYEKGNRVFDADMAFTSDGHLVLRHEWSDGLEVNGKSMESGIWWTDDNGMYRNSTTTEVMTYKEFMETKEFQKYTTMSCEDMLCYMNDHVDLYVTVDMKDDPETAYKYLVEQAGSLGYGNVLDRIIVNIYDYEMYDKIMNIYKFKNVTARQHKVSPNNYYELIRFCVKHDIHVVNVSRCFMKDNEIGLFKEYGIHVYTAVVDYVSDMQNYVDLGASGAVTNWLYETDWKYISEN